LKNKKKTIQQEKAKTKIKVIYDCSQKISFVHPFCMNKTFLIHEEYIFLCFHVEFWCATSVFSIIIVYISLMISTGTFFFRMHDEFNSFFLHVSAIKIEIKIWMKIVLSSKKKKAIAFAKKNYFVGKVKYVTSFSS
jgi:hypothetical protein